MPNEDKHHSMSDWEDRIFLTFDIDWAADEVIEFTVSILDRLEVTDATFFVTHQSHALDLLREQGYELGVHPNFEESQGTGPGSDIVAKICSLKELVPEASSVRSHRLVRSSRLSSLFLREGFTHESNLLIPFQSGIRLCPYEEPKGLVQMPHNWGDYAHLAATGELAPAMYLRAAGLKVLSFHPIHVYLNTPDLAAYARAKPYREDIDKLRRFRTDTTTGIRSLLERFIMEARDAGFRWGRINQARP